METSLNLGSSTNKPIWTAGATYQVWDMLFSKDQQSIIAVGMTAYPLATSGVIAKINIQTKQNEWEIKPSESFRITQVTPGSSANDYWIGSTTFKPTIQDSNKYGVAWYNVYNDSSESRVRQFDIESNGRDVDYPLIGFSSQQGSGFWDLSSQRLSSGATVPVLRNNRLFEVEISNAPEVNVHSAFFDEIEEILYIVGWDSRNRSEASIYSLKIDHPKFNANKASLGSTWSKISTLSIANTSVDQIIITDLELNSATNEVLFCGGAYSFEHKIAYGLTGQHSLTNNSLSLKHFILNEGSLADGGVSQNALTQLKLDSSGNIIVSGYYAVDGGEVRTLLGLKDKVSDALEFRSFDVQNSKWDLTRDFEIDPTGQVYIGGAGISLLGQIDNIFSRTTETIDTTQPGFYGIETVFDSSDVGVSGSGNGSYGLYLISGLEGRNGSVLAVTDADLDTDDQVDSSSLTIPALPLLTAAGALFPSTNQPVAIRMDGSNVELLYKPSITNTTYITQDFSLLTGRAIGAPTPPSSSLQAFEIPYDQDLDGDGITGPALTITETIDSADTGAGGDAAGTYGLYRISGLSGKTASQLAISQADLEEGSTIAQSELDPLLPLLTTRGTSLPAAWQPLAIRQDDIDGRIELLYKPTPTATSYQTQDFSLSTGRAIGAPTAAVKSLQSFEIRYDQDLDLDGVIGLSLSVQSVLDPADVGAGGDDSATYGLYRISGINGSPTAALAVADAGLEDSQLVPQSELSTLLPLLTSAGKTLPAAWQPLAIRQDDIDGRIELLYKPTPTATSYQTQDFSLTTGRAIGKPSAPLSSLLSLEVPYDQDFNEDGVLGVNITQIGETQAVVGTTGKDRLTLASMDIGYGGGADDTLLVAPDVSSNDPITMLGGSGNDTYTAKAGAFLVIYDLGTTKDTKDLLTGLPGSLKQWSLYRVETNDFLLQHSATNTAVLLVDPLGKASQGNKLESIRFSTGAAQTMAALTNTRTGILSSEPAITYADFTGRFGYDIAFAYSIPQEAGPLSIQSDLRNNLNMLL